jgi:hypothetical protein
MRRAMKYLLMISTMAAFLAVASAAHSEDVDGPWINAVGFGDGPIWNPSTNDPTVGEDPNDPTVSFNDADQEMVWSPFTNIALANPGDKVVFTGSVELLGTLNSPQTSGSPRTQFRFGLFKDDGDGDDLEWVGYLTTNRHGNSGTPAGSISRKNVGNTNVFLSVTAGANSLVSQQGDGTGASLFNDGTYDLMMSIERNAAGELVLNSSIAGVGDRPPLEPYDPLDPPASPGPNQYSQVLSFTDTLASTMGTYQFDRLGFLTGGNLDTDRAAYTNLEVNFIPGSAAGLAGDFNEDEIVDAADYVTWRANESANLPLPNDTGAANQAARYDVWTANFGESAPGGGSGLGVVPEPASLVLVAMAAMLLIATARRRLEPAFAGAHR